MGKPALFVGSSSEQLLTARAIKTLLQRDAEVKVWDKGVFNLGTSTLDDLLGALEEFDFAVFVFQADDLTRIREIQKPTVRDNVVFELGLFMGRMGKERTFWVTPRGDKAPHVPTDLSGITQASFHPPRKSRDDRKLRASLGPACDMIRKKIVERGKRKDHLIDEVHKPRILCAASPQFCELGFTGDVSEIKSAFRRKGCVTASHEVNAPQLRQLLLDRQKWDIIHLVVYVDTVSGDVILDHVNFDKGYYPPKTDNRITAAGLCKLVEDANARLVVLNVCDSSALAIRLVRQTNVIAGSGLIGSGVAIDWTRIFYTALSRGKTLSDAFDLSQQSTAANLVLLKKQDLRINIPGITN
jgi:hypothetical protein